MVILKNNIACMEELFSLNKRVVLYGAGATCKLILQGYYDTGLKDKIEYVVDGNADLDGTDCVVDDSIKVRVLSLQHFIHIVRESKQDYIILMTPYNSLSYIRQLDQIQELDGMNVYLFSLIVNHKVPEAFSFRNTVQPLIPKIIHYIWIGDNPIPDEDKKNIESWHRFCPDYEIKLWNEENYDFHKNLYAHEAIKNKLYMYARKDILYHYGGIYFDTDVELLGPIDDLLYNEAFIGVEDGGQINSGSGLGAMKHHPVIKEMRDIYHDVSFRDKNGQINRKYNTYYETQYMLKQG